MAYVGYGYYKDENGNVYKMVNGKRSYLDPKLNVDDGGKLINTRGMIVYKDSKGTYQYESDGVTKKYTNPKLNEKQMSIGDLKQQDYAKKNKELQAQQEAENKAKAEQAAYDAIQVRKISTMMNSFKLTLDKLKSKFCENRAVYTMYVKMTLNNNNIVLVDTTSSDWDENCLVSFKYELNGSGEANQFTLSLLYKPNDRSYSSIKTLESALLSNVGITTDKTGKTLKDINVLYNNCSFKYGYGDESDLRSPTYNGMITDYDCKIDNGNLRYTISGIGGLTSLKETRISAKDEYLKDGDIDVSQSPLLYIKNIVKIELESKGLYTMQILDDIDPKEVVTIGDDYKQFNQKNIFQVISDILSQCITKKQKDTLTGDKRILPTQKQIFGYFVDDSPTKGDDGKTYKGAIYIYKLPAANGPENKANAENPQPDLGITFNWFGPGNDGYTGIVKDWVPKYDGSVLFGLAVNLLSHDDSTSYYTMDEEGNIVTVQGLGAAREGTLGTTDKGIASTIQEYSNWAFVTQYPYSATMTMIGCPCEVPMIGKIAINALMGSEKHHSSGVYYVLKKTDTINNSGFWSEFELFKIVPTYDPDYSEIKSNDSITQSPVSPDNIDKANEKVTNLDVLNAGLGPRNSDNYTKDENGNLIEKDKNNILNIPIDDNPWDPNLFKFNNSNNNNNSHGGRGGTY